MSTVLFLFRQDLRLHDQLALHTALGLGCDYLLPVFCHRDPLEISPWGFVRTGKHRQAWLDSALAGLREQLAQRNCPLLECNGPPAAVLPELARAVGASVLVCEEIAAPEEQAEVDALRQSGLHVHTVWQSSMLAPDSLPWESSRMPDVFTQFRQLIEKQGLFATAALSAPLTLPSWPEQAAGIPEHLLYQAPSLSSGQVQRSDLSEKRSSFPYWQPEFDGAETAALRHLANYFSSDLPHTYKRTRNGLHGISYSSKWSPWLSTGALSARQICVALNDFTSRQGANESTYWLWFELLWRDYFRFLHKKYGRRLYHASGLLPHTDILHQPAAFSLWCQGNTGEALVDAGMHELMATGYLSNRLRQVVASYLIYELGGDWRAGAAWFEAQLIDYDVYSNQGNWLYIAGRGTDPRGGRRFDVHKQTRQHDADGSYRRLWGQTATPV